MKKSNKIVASAMAVSMLISVTAPSIEAYSRTLNLGADNFEIAKRLRGSNEESSFTFARVKDNKENIASTGEILNIELFASKSIDPDIIGVQIKDERGKIIKLNEGDVSVTGDKEKTKREIALKMPANETEEEKTYKIRFTENNKAQAPIYGEEPVITVTQSPSESNRMIVNKFTANKVNLTEAGGKITFSAEGKNLDSDKLSLEIKNGSDRDVTAQILGTNTKFEGTSDKKILNVEFPRLMNGKESEVYKISLKSDKSVLGTTSVTLKREQNIESAVKSVTPSSKTINSDDQTVEFKLSTDEGLSNGDIISSVTCNGIYSAVTPVIEGSGSERTGKIQIPKNTTSKEKVYEIKFAEKGKAFSEKLKLTITQSVDENMPVIYTVDPNSMNIGADSKQIEFKVTTKNITSDNLGVKVSSGGEVLKISDIAVTGEKAAKTVKLTLPENKTYSKKIYDITFYPKDNPDFTGSPVLTVNQDGRERKKELTVSSFESKIPNLPAKGGETSVTVKGENLNSERISLKVEKGNTDVTDIISGAGDKFLGTDKVMSNTLKFPKLSSENEDKYKVILLVDGKEKSSTLISVSKDGTDKEDVEMSLRTVYLKSENQIILENYENVYEIKEGTLKDNISIKIDGDEYKKLGAEDRVEIEDNIIKITLKNPIEVSKLSSSSKVKIEKRILKDSDGNPFKESEFTLNGFIPVVNTEEVVKGDILDSKGGEVEIVLNGSNLVNTDDENALNGTKVKVIKKQNTELGSEYIKGVTVTGEGDKQVIKFRLPENKTNRTESYTVLISLDNGKTYSPEVAWNIYSRGDRIAPAVLPEGKTKDDQTLGFMSIQSYGTSGGGSEGVDNTHTTTPTNQESKKTFVHLYGTNLKKDKTKVRIIHNETGVVFVPTNEPAKDSGDRFIMVGFDATGIIGDGNHQQLEIIAPRGYRGDNTYTYQVAIDGVHFDQEMTVSVTVPDDGEDPGQRPVPSEVVRDITVKYQDENGKEIAPSENHRLFKDQQFYTSEISPKEIEGYKYDETKGIKDAKQRLEALENKGEKRTEEENTEMKGIKNLLDNVIVQKHGELEMTPSNNPGTKGEVIFVYNTNESSVPVVPVRPDNISNPEINEGKDESTKVDFERIAGENRYSTSLKISNKAFKSAERVYVVSGEKFPDALTVSALTPENDAPILLINDKNVDLILKEIDRLGAKEVVLVGGNAISQANEQKLENHNKEKIKLRKIAGKDRYETAAKLAEETILKYGNKGKVIIADGRNYPDALSIASYASETGIPILLTNGGTISDAEKNIINKYNIKEAIIIGGEKAVGKNIEKLFDKTERIYGQNRYETSKKVAEKFFKNSDTIFMTSGEGFADALSVSYYAGEKNAPILLTNSDKLNSNAKDYLDNNKGKNIIVIGGEMAVKSDIFK